LSGTKYLVSIDPGMSTGVTVGTYSDTDPYTLLNAYQIEGGVEGFLEFVDVRDGETFPDEKYYTCVSFGKPFTEGGSSYYLVEEVFQECEWQADTRCDEDEDGSKHQCYDTFVTSPTTVVAEKFTARGSGNAFSYRTNALEPLRIEGALLALGLEPSWQYPQNMYFMVPSGFKGNKKSLAHKWLKDNGLYVSPKDVGCKDADDVRSSILHALVYMRKIGHKPTLERYFKK